MTQIKVMRDADGEVYIPVAWVAGRIRKWAGDFRDTPAEYLERPAPDLLLAITSFLDHEADGLDIAVIDSLTNGDTP